jgi:hypothetical protein
MSHAVHWSLPRPRLLLTLAVAAALFATGCGDSSTGIGPGNQLEIQNQVDQFQFQLIALDGVSDRRSYDWENTGTQATIDISEAIAGGSATLTIRDAAGTVMYDDEISEDGDGTTPVGVAGSWQIEVVLSGTTGAFNFRVQKAT